MNDLFDVPGKVALVTDIENFVERARKEMALGRGGEADEIVGAALSFASRVSSFTTGAVLAVHGGIR